MIITYNGKEYFCRMLDNGKVELRTNEYVDDTFKYIDGLYIKYVDISECKNLKYMWIFAVYNDESIEVFKMDSDKYQLLVTTGFSYGYSKTFIQDVLGGVEGRDIDAWCDIDVFSGFFMRTRDDITKEKKDIILDKERALEYIDLMRPESWGKR
jgi:hypothetical protein